MHTSYDAVLIISFGGPEGMEDVMPFLENVTRGRNIPQARLLEVAKHYELFGGVSPINAQVRRLISSLQQAMNENGPRLPIYWGNRNWHPLLADTIRQMQRDGIKHALAFVTSAYSSYSSCKQYLDDIVKARAEVGPGAPQIDKIRAFYNHPIFVECNVENLQKAAEQIPAGSIASAAVAFTAHSIPVSMSSACKYLEQLNDICAHVAEKCKLSNWKLVFQSRSGPPQVPWLEPDILEHIRSLHDQGVEELIIHPIGFVSDHMEVIYDLDYEAKTLCDELHIKMFRTQTAGSHPKFVKLVRQLILERIDEVGRPFVGTMGAVHDVCPSDCCPSGMAPHPVSQPSAPEKH